MVQQETTVQQEFDRLLQAYHSGSPLALLLDYDGTLTPIVEHPDKAELPSRARWLLCCLSRQKHLTMGVLSGRSLANLKQMVGLEGLIYAGNSGLELEIGGRTILHPQAETSRRLLVQVAREWQPLVSSVPRAWIEDKMLGLTLHFRQVAPELRPSLVERSRALLDCFADRLRVVPGPLALEVCPVPDWNKGSAVERVLEEMDAETFPFYAGDSANDREAFQIVAGRGGMTVGVGPEAPLEAQHTVPTPDTLIDLLAQMLPAITVAGMK
jgi:trehalose-phosphatase